MITRGSIIPAPYQRTIDEPTIKIRPYDPVPVIRNLRGSNIVHPPYDRMVLASVPLLDQSGVFSRPISPVVRFHFVRVAVMKPYEYRESVRMDYPPWIKRATRFCVPVYHSCILMPSVDGNRSGGSVYAAQPASRVEARVYFYNAIRSNAGTAAKAAHKLFYQINDEGGDDSLLYDDGSRPLIVISEGKGAQFLDFGMVEALWKTVKSQYPNIAALAELSV